MINSFAPLMRLGHARDPPCENNNQDETPDGNEQMRLSVWSIQTGVTAWSFPAILLSKCASSELLLPPATVRSAAVVAGSHSAPVRSTGGARFPAFQMLVVSDLTLTRKSGGVLFSTASL